MGADKKAFDVHRNISCNSAPYFQAALKGGFLESETQILDLPEDDPRVFGYLLIWLYTGQIIPGLQADDDGNSAQEVLIGLYIFGEARGIQKLLNNIIDELIDHIEHAHLISDNLLPSVYNETPLGSPLRRVYADYVAREGRLTRDEWFKPEMKSGILGHSQLM